MDGRLAVEVMKATGSGARRRKAEDPSGVRRGRPGRRSVDEGKEAVVEPLPGKAPADQVAFPFWGGPPRRWRSGVRWPWKVLSIPWGRGFEAGLHGSGHYWGVEHTLAPVGASCWQRIGRTFDPEAEGGAHLDPGLGDDLRAS
jgi:hypothetical protein